jgi:hypothetical protein
VNRDRAEAPRTGLYCTSYTDTHHTPGPCSCVPPASPNHVPDCFTISISTPRAMSSAFEPHAVSDHGWRMPPSKVREGHPDSIALPISDSVAVPTSLLHPGWSPVPTIAPRKVIASSDHPFLLHPVGSRRQLLHPGRSTTGSPRYPADAHHHLTDRVFPTAAGTAAPTVAPRRATTILLHPDGPLVSPVAPRTVDGRLVINDCSGPKPTAHGYSYWCTDQVPTMAGY